MRRSWKSPTRARGGALLRAGLWCAAALGVTWVPASAQVQIPQDGRLFDASTQIGGTGQNFPRPRSPLLLGNSVATGNVRSGQAFQGFQPISDPTSFLTTIPSGALSDFRRDSVSVADAAFAYPMIGAPWYSPSLTAPTAGFLSGQFLPRTTVPAQRLQPVREVGRLSDGLPRLGAVPPSEVRASREVLSNQIVGAFPGDLTSSIFGLPPQNIQTLTQQVTAPPLVTPGVVGAQATLGQTGINYTPPYTREVPGSRAPVYTQDIPGSRPLLGTPLELVRRGETLRPVEEPADELSAVLEAEESRAAPLTFGPGAVAERFGEVRMPRPEAEGDRMAALPGLPAPLQDTSVLPGFDVFTDMQLALALSGNPTADWFGQMQKAIREDPTTAVMLRERAEIDAGQFVQQMLGSPIETFHGRGESPKNNEMLRAESLMEIGHYFEAARRYEMAHNLDPLDPLPLVGKGNALLAAGEYLTAALALVQGFERYPELSRFEFNLPNLIGGREIIDIRRAEIMRTLESKDDPRLRFLLGYLEYYAGDAKLRESGLRNLDRAAALDLKGTLISRFPALLRQEGAIPPPKLPKQEEVLPEQLPTRAGPGETGRPEPAPLPIPERNPLETGEPK